MSLALAVVALHALPGLGAVARDVALLLAIEALVGAAHGALAAEVALLAALEALGRGLVAVAAAPGVAVVAAAASASPTSTVVS